MSTLGCEFCVCLLLLSVIFNHGVQSINPSNLAISSNLWNDFDTTDLETSTDARSPKLNEPLDEVSFDEVSSKADNGESDVEDDDDPIPLGSNDDPTGQNDPFFDDTPSDNYGDTWLHSDEWDLAKKHHTNYGSSGWGGDNLDWETKDADSGYVDGTQGDDDKKKEKWKNIYHKQTTGADAKVRDDDTSKGPMKGRV